MKRTTIIATVFAIHLVPVAAWAVVKPLRVIAPELLGLSCSSDNVCIDDPARLQEARALLATSVSFVEQELGHLQSRPKAVFCSTSECASKFGLGRSAAFSIGLSGVVFSERAWQPHFVRHELIHRLQNERLGVRLGPNMFARHAPQTHPRPDWVVKLAPTTRQMATSLNSRLACGERS